MGAIALDESPAALKLRAFFGLPVPETQRAVLADYVQRCAALAPDFRWVPPPNLHVTVRFLGHVERTSTDAIVDALSATPPSGFELELGELGTFKRGRLARVVWIGLRRDVAAARELAARVETECRRVGLEPEERAFQAHLTLARARGREGSVLPDLPPAPPVDAWRADELVLYQSHLSRSGSTYEPIRVIPLS